jgi:hypothetical protein
VSTIAAIRRGASVQREAQAAADELFAALDQPDIRLVVFYCAADFDLEALAAALRFKFGRLPMIGCTTAGEITPRGYLSGSITGFSLAAPDFDVATLLIDLNPFDSSAASAEVRALAERLAQADDSRLAADNAFAMMLIDGLSMQEELVVSCVHQSLQGVDLVGGSAADDTRFAATHVYYDGRFLRNAALVALVRCRLPFMAFRTQHFTQSDQRMVVTRADPVKRQVFEINGLPAAREFARLVNLPIAELTPMIFATHPVVVRVGGQYFVRSIAKVNADESLSFFCAIDEGIVLTIAKGVDMVENLQHAFDGVRKQLGEPALVVGCDCILRRLETEREGIKENIGRIFSANNVVGFATYGEQFNSMHVNQTFTGIAIGQRN